jgi:hypothetical protein
METNHPPGSARPVEILLKTKGGRTAFSGLEVWLGARTLL